MKRLTVAIFCVFLILAAAPFKPVFAAPPTYARATDRSAYFYKEKDSSALFAVPYTYCIEILRDEGDWYFARYADDAGVYEAVEGYCKKEHFEPEYETPKTTYLYRQVTIKLSAGDPPPFLPAVEELALDAAYYGAVDWAGEAYAYVLCHGTFIYVKDNFGDYELNTPTRTPDDDGGGLEGGGSGINFATVAFIVIASLSVVVILIIYFTTKKPRIDG